MSQQRRGAPDVTMSTSKEKLFTADFLLVSFTTLAAFFSFYFLMATLPIYVIRIGGTEAQVGLILGVFGATAVALRPFVGKATDDHGKRLFILAGNGLLCIASGLYTLIVSVPLLLGLRVFHGVGWASFTTASSALAADLAPRSRRGEAMGYFGMFSNLAMAAGPALGVVLMNSYSFPVLFASAAGVALLATLLSLRLKEPLRSAQQVPPKGSNQGVIEHTALFPAAVLFLTTITYGSIVSFLPIFATRQGIDNPGLFFTAYAITLIAARSFTGQLSDRFGRTVVIAPGLGLAAIALWILSTASSMAAFLVVAALYGLAFAAIHPTLMAFVVDRAAPHRRGAAMGTFSTAMDLGISTGSFLWGFVAQTAGYGTMYVASGIVALIALVVFLIGAKSR